MNNAGIGMRTVNPPFLDQPMPFFDVPADGFADVVATNLTRYFLVAEAFAARFAARGAGRFINVSVNHETMRRRVSSPTGHRGPGRRH